MRIDATSLIAAQLAQRPSPASSAAGLGTREASDKPLFEPLIFPLAPTENASPKAQGTAPQTRVGRPGAQLDITV